MKKIYVRKGKINEDGPTAQQSADQNVPQAQQSVTPQQQTVNTPGKEAVDIKSAELEFNNLQQQAITLKKEYETKMAAIRQAVQKLNSKLIGTNVKFTLTESFADNGKFLISDLIFSRKLFEAQKGNSLVREWQRLLYTAVDNANTSNTPTYETFYSKARIINNKIFDWKEKGDTAWNKEIVPKNHWEEVSEFIKAQLQCMRHPSWTDSELTRIMDAMEERVKSSASFSWIFGKDKDKK